MPAIPLGLKSYKRANGFQPEVRLVNLVIEQDDSGGSPDNTMRIQRPGLDAYKMLPGIGRGIFYDTATSLWYCVAGTTLYAMETSENLGTVPGSGLVSFAATFDAVYVLGSGIVCRWDGVAFSTISLPSDYAGSVIDIETINSYVILFCSTGRFYWLEPGQVVIDPLNFATAESSPDGGIGVRRLVDELFFGGPVSIEPWQPTGDIDAPFQKASGRQFERGVLARDTLQRFDNSLVWVGEDLIVYRVGAVPQRISDFGIEERLRKRAGDPYAWRFSTDGHNYYVLTIPGQGTFAFDASSSQWSEFATIGRTQWTGSFGAQSPNRALTGDVTSGQIYQVNPDGATDAGIAQPRIVTGTVPLTGAGGRNDSFALGIGALDECTVKIRWRDGDDEFPSYYEELPVQAGGDVVSLYRLGSFDRPFRTFEVRVDDPTLVRISGAVINEAYR